MVHQSAEVIAKQFLAEAVAGSCLDPKAAELNLHGAAEHLGCTI